MKILKSKKGFSPLLAAVLLSGVGWIVFKVIIGISIGKAINQTTLIILGTMAAIVLFALLSGKRSVKSITHGG